MICFFADTPQGKSLWAQVGNATSTFKRTGLKAVYEEARKFYESEGEQMARTQRHFPPYPQRAGHAAGISSNGHEELNMSLEQALAANTAALEANTAALLGAKPAAAAPAAAPATAKAKPPKETVAPKSKNTREEMAAILNKLKEEKGKELPKAIILESGGCAKMADIPEDKIDAVFDAATAALTAEADDDI